MLTVVSCIRARSGILSDSHWNEKVCRDDHRPILLKNSFFGAAQELPGPQRGRSFSERGGPCDPLLRVTNSLLTSAPTIRRVNCRLQCTLTRMLGECNSEFFNRIGQKRILGLEQVMSVTSWSQLERPAAVESNISAHWTLQRTSTHDVSQLLDKPHCL